MTAGFIKMVQTDQFPCGSAEKASLQVIFRPMMKLRILLIDDHAMFRTGLRMVLARGIPDVEIHEAPSSDKALQETPGDIDVVLLDIRLEGLSGLESIALLKRRWPAVPILMLSGEDDPETIRLAMERGAAGFVAKAMPAEKIVEAIMEVFSGQPAAPIALPRESEPHLTPRQCEVLQLLDQGLSNKLIARRLTLSENTVRRHVQDIIEHFCASSRAEAVFAARRQGILG